MSAQRGFQHTTPVWMTTTRLLCSYSYRRYFVLVIWWSIISIHFHFTGLTFSTHHLHFTHPVFSAPGDVISWDWRALFDFFDFLHRKNSDDDDFGWSRFFWPIFGWILANFEKKTKILTFWRKWALDFILPSLDAQYMNFIEKFSPENDWLIFEFLNFCYGLHFSIIGCATYNFNWEKIFSTRKNENLAVFT